MRVVMNQWMTLGPKTGVGHYAAELFRCLDSSGAEIGVFPQGWLRRAKQIWASARSSMTRPPSSSPGVALHGFGPQIRSRIAHEAAALGRAAFTQMFQSFCSRRRCLLYHEPNFIPLPVDLPTVTTIHDLSVLLHPEWHPAGRVAHFARHFERGLARSQHFLAISEFGRQEIIRTLNISGERVTRTYMGVRAGLGPMPRQQVALALRRLGLPEQYLLYLGTIEPRKNVLMLLRAYCALPAPLRARWPLLLVGGWGWHSGDVAEFLQTEARHRGVIHIGYAAEEHLPILYNGARALLYPSYYEGFGLPPVEMLACGGAVLASTAGAIAEVVGGCAQLIPPEDQDGWRQAMIRVIQDDDWRQSLRQHAVSTARPFTWQRCAARTADVYRFLCGSATDISSAFRAAG